MARWFCGLFVCSFVALLPNIVRKNALAEIDATFDHTFAQIVQIRAKMSQKDLKWSQKAAKGSQNGAKGKQNGCKGEQNGAKGEQQMPKCIQTCIENLILEKGGFLDAFQVTLWAPFC